jgi:hypothetical protein
MKVSETNREVEGREKAGEWEEGVMEEVDVMKAHYTHVYKCHDETCYCVQFSTCQ